MTLLRIAKTNDCERCPDSYAYEQIISDQDSGLSKDTPLYRYLSDKRFETLLINKELSFSKITTWDDRQEGLRLCAMEVKMPEHPYATKNLDKFYASCWTLQTENRQLFESEDDYQKSVAELAKDGSDAMWRAYCGNGGVRIKTTLGKLEELILATSLPTSAIHSGKVHYDPYASNWGKTLRSKHFAAAFLHKRVCFRSEAEFRFLFCASDSVKDDYINLPVPKLYSLIDEVLVSPATQKNISRSHNLVHLTRTIYPENDLAARGNIKNGTQLCRISQLYHTLAFPT